MEIPYPPPPSDLWKLLDYQVTRKICVGQVIVTLAGCCKELIDNALDAGATIVEIRAKEFGYEMLEVVDNGCGILPNDFDALCKPHSTSKISSAEDFKSLETFGFRGEALNALSAITWPQLFKDNARLYPVNQQLTSVIGL